jgi:S1-C subfamily serine protease
MKTLLLIVLANFLFGCAQKIAVIRVDDISPKKIESKQNFFFEVDDVGMGVPKGTVVEVRNGGIFCELHMGSFISDPGKDEGQTSMSEAKRYIKDELEKYQIKTTALNVGYTLKPSITRQSINSCTPFSWDINKYQGEFFISIRWQVVRDDDGFVLFNYETEAFEELLKPVDDGARILLESVFKENVRKLVANEDFRLLITLDATEKAPPQTQATSTNNIVDEKYNSLRIDQKNSDILSNEKSSWKEGVFTIMTDDASGSSFAISEKFVLTNHHVVGNNEVVTVKMSQEDGSFKAWNGRVIRKNAERDIALIEIDGSLKKYFSLSNSKPKQGDDIYVLGSPFGHANESTLTKGIISHSNRKIQGLSYIQSDANIYTGNSGGPMIDIKGHILGISVLSHKGAEGLNLFIPIDSALEYLNLEVK